MYLRCVVIDNVRYCYIYCYTMYFRCVVIDNVRYCYIVLLIIKYVYKR